LWHGGQASKQALAKVLMRGMPFETEGGPRKGERQAERIGQQIISRARQLVRAECSDAWWYSNSVWQRWKSSRQGPDVFSK
jgi:hypothetical protein